jgi:tRNA pseudouridine55 synthase
VVKIEEMMNGVLVIDKPAGITSHDVVARVRRALGTRRVGHTGTLDPFATGVMAVLVGNATRLAQFLDKDEKEYVAEMQFGFETDTGDRTGNPKPDSQTERRANRDEIERVLTKFTGEIEQTPPMYSAKKVAGKKLYELARAGKEVERKGVPVTIRELELLDYNGDWARLRVVCSAGTYIRTIAEDIARAAGSAAHLTELRRIRSGRFDIANSVVLDNLKHDSPLLSANEALSHVPEFSVPEERVSRTLNGLATRANEVAFTDGEYVRMLSPTGELIAIGVYVSDEPAVKPKVVLS